MKSSEFLSICVTSIRLSNIFTYYVTNSNWSN